MDQFIGEPGLWNQGIGSQLVKETVVFLLTVKRADKIVMDPQSWNHRALRVYEKNGFVRKKLLPEHEWHEGEYRDCWLIEYSGTGTKEMLMKNQLSLLAASLILGLSIITGCMIISNDRPAGSGQAVEAQATENKLLLTLQETAVLLGISEDQVMNIMKAENSLLSNDGPFGGTKIPYIKVDAQFLFNKAGLLEWIQAATTEKRVYSGAKMLK